MLLNTVEPLIKDTLNEGHLCIKDTFPCTSGNKFLPLKSYCHYNYTGLYTEFFLGGGGGGRRGMLQLYGTV